MANNQEEFERPLRMMLPRHALGQHVREAMGRAGLVLSQRLREDGQMHVDDDPRVLSALGCPLGSLTLAEEDIPIYVEHGVAEVGVVRAHLLHETDVEVYRPFTFDFEAGSLALVAPQTTTLEELASMPLQRVATRYRRFARDTFTGRGWNVELIPISAAVELAPLLGLADAVLMVVDDRRALERRGLHVVEEVGVCRAKLIANRAIGRHRMRVIERLIELLTHTAEGEQVI